MSDAQLGLPLRGRRSECEAPDRLLTSGGRTDPADPMWATTRLNLGRRHAVPAEARGRAMNLFGKRSFEKTTVEEIVRAVGISASSFFRMSRVSFARA